MKPNHYVVLGIKPGATQDEIKSAYRAKVKALHPDHYPGGSGPFREVQEAYEVLGDPACRRAYDAELARTHSARVVPGRSRRCPVEPLIPTERTYRAEEPWSGRAHTSPLDEVLSDLWQDWDMPAPARTTRSNELQVQVSLSPRTARYGGRLRLWIPVESPCQACLGRGRVVFLECPWCLGRGAFVQQHPVEIDLPAGIADGATGHVALDPPGLDRLHLSLRFRIDGW